MLALDYFHPILLYENSFKETFFKKHCSDYVLEGSWYPLDTGGKWNVHRRSEDV